MSEHEEPTPPEATAPATAQAEEEKKEPKIIKRYTNRKLYDTVESRYVTLDEIAQMIKGGAEVKIIDNRSKEDLTSVTLAQIIFEEEKKRSQMPLGMLREIIRHGGEAVAGFYQEKAGSLAGALGELRNRTDSLRGELEQKVRTRTEVLRDELEQKVRGVTGIFKGKGEEAASAVEELKDAAQDLRGKVEGAAKQVSDAAAAEIDRLQKRVQELEKKLEQLVK